MSESLWKAVVLICAVGVCVLLRAVFETLDRHYSPAPPQRPPALGDWSHLQALRRALQEARPVPKPRLKAPPEIAAFVMGALGDPIDRTAAMVLRDWLEEHTHPAARAYRARHEVWVARWEKVRDRTTSEDKRRLRLADGRFREWVRKKFGDV